MNSGSVYLHSSTWRHTGLLFGNDPICWFEVKLKEFNISLVASATRITWPV